MAQSNGAPPAHHEKFMTQALLEAQRAFDESEAPIGAVVVFENKIIGRGYNRTISLEDPTAHAEMIAITSAAETVGDWRLENCDLYSTIEPCIMCAGASVIARMRHIYYGAPEPKFGGCGSILDIPNEQQLNHNCGVTGGILQQDCAELMQRFFKRLRENKRLLH